jgi:hypothetical protein
MHKAAPPLPPTVPPPDLRLAFVIGNISASIVVKAGAASPADIELTTQWLELAKVAMRSCAAVGTKQDVESEEEANV